jgi:ribose 5-phosphate isomerase B
MIYLGSDHGGFALKNQIKKYLDSEEIPYKDLGNTTLDPDDDYPDFAFRVAEQVSESETDAPWNKRPKGVLLCRSSGGMVIAANKVRCIRAVSVTDIRSAKHARTDNDANIIALPADWISSKEAIRVLKVWLNTEFSKQKRHIRRIKKIEEYESE